MAHSHGSVLIKRRWRPLHLIALKPHVSELSECGEFLLLSYVKSAGLALFIGIEQRKHTEADIKLLEEPEDLIDRGYVPRGQHRDASDLPCRSQAAKVGD